MTEKTFGLHHKTHPVPEYLADAVFNVPLPAELREKFSISEKWPLHMQWAVLGFLQAYKIGIRPRGRPRGAGKDYDLEIVACIEEAAREDGISFNKMLARAVPSLIHEGWLPEIVGADSTVDPTTHPKRLKRVKMQRDAKAREEARLLAAAILADKK